MFSKDGETFFLSCEVLSSEGQKIATDRRGTDRESIIMEPTVQSNETGMAFSEEAVSIQVFNTAIFADSSNSDSGDFSHSSDGYGLVLLNSTGMFTPLVLSYWNRCRLRVCADGAINRLYDNLTEQQRGEYLPDAVCGDLDSAEEAILDYYR
jgi:hypothetical protein